MYIRCIYSIFGREITEYAVIYGVYIRFWPTLLILLSTIFPQLLASISNCKDKLKNALLFFLKHHCPTVADQHLQLQGQHAVVYNT